MMSPLSVAQYLPTDAAAFDLVIFDEASQIATWDAIGAIGRGQQVVVVGDPRQLPPTSFFARRPDEADDDRVETQDLESILDECLGVGMPSIELTWHYRSRHESLIAFSNRKYYGGRLVTFPSPVTNDRAVSFRHVANGVYGRGESRTNEIEARAVVAEALAILRAEPPRSLGIVTFNAEQQSLVEDLMDRARAEDPALEHWFAEDAAEPVMIKNLEGVQGEERDVMLFSLTYGPDATGRSSVNFGPLNQAGGERRLNVAVTRAREALIVFGSLRPEQIDLSRTQAAGVADLKLFLEFADRGIGAFAAAASRPLGDHESPFEMQVAAWLRRKAWVTHPQIGVSGFRIDLGVVDPDAPGRFLAGVECDGATYHSGATARDRDRLRQAVLKGLGWTILRVWSTDWWTNAARESERLHLALTAALRQARAERDSADAVVVAPDVRALDAPTDPSATPPAPDAGEVLAADGARFHDPEYREHLERIVTDALARMAPVLADRLAQHVARLHGFARTGRDIREKVLAVLPVDSARSVETVGTFIWPPGVSPAAWDRFRGPASGETGDPGDIPIEELTVLARAARRLHPERERAVLAMRDACGLKRLSEPARIRCLEAIAAAVD